MGSDCCKKKKNKEHSKNMDLNSSEKIKNEKLHLKGNKGQKNFNEQNDENNDDNNYMQGYELNKTENKTSSRQEMIKGNINEEKNTENKKKYNPDPKIQSQYENLLLSYLLLHEQLKKEEKNLKLFIVKKKDIEYIIPLYKQVITNENYQLNKNENEKRKIIGKVVNDFLENNNIEINKKLNILNYEDCKNDLMIDFVDKDYIKKIGVKMDKSKEARCFEYINDFTKYIITLEFVKTNDKIKIEERNDIYYIRKDPVYKKENFNINDFEFFDNKSEIKKNNISNSDNINGNKSDKDNKDNNLEDNITNSLKNIELNVMNKEEEIVQMVFMFLILFKIQNETIFFSDNKHYYENFDNNGYFYLINRNFIINLKNEIINKNKANLNLLLHNFLQKKKYEKFEEFIEKKEIILEEFKKENRNLFHNDYSFKNINSKDIIANNNEIINNINNNKIIFPFNFVLIKQDLYELLLKIISDKESNNEPKNETKYSILFCGKQIFLRTFNEQENIIYVCDFVKTENEKENDLDINIDISFILTFKLKENFLNEYNLFMKNNDIYNYINKRKLKVNIKEAKKIINDNNEEIGFFINLKNKDLIIENDNNEKKENNTQINENDKIIIENFENNINENNENKNCIIEVNESKNNEPMIEDDINKNDIIENGENKKNMIKEEENKKNLIEDISNKKNLIESDVNRNNLIDTKESRNSIVEFDRNKNEIIQIEKSKNKHFEVDKNKNNIIEEDINKNNIIEINENKNYIIEDEGNKNSIIKDDENRNYIIEVNENKNGNIKIDEGKNKIIEDDNKNNKNDSEENKIKLIEDDKNNNSENNISKNNEKQTDIQINNLEKENNIIIENDNNLEKKSIQESIKCNLIIEDNEKEEEKKIIIVGLINPGSNSYINSILQCLYHIPQLTNYFMTNNLFNIEQEKNSDIIEDNYLLDNNKINRNSLSYKYYEVIYHLYYKKEDSKIIESYFPANFINYLNSSKEFIQNKQNDPQKLLIYILDNLEKELNQKENLRTLNNIDNFTSISSSIQNNNDISFSLYKKFLDDYKFRHNSIISDIFLGIKSKIFECSKCNEINYLFKPFYILNFPLSNIKKRLDKDEKITLDKCFEYKYSKQKLNCTESCKKCMEKTNGTFYNQIFISPEVLIIILDNINGYGNKFKLSLELNINDYLIEKNNGYKLIGIITYFKEKGMNEQYIPYCKSEIDGNWYCCVDNCIYKNNNFEEDMEDKNRIPYILFFINNKTKKE